MHRCKTSEPAVLSPAGDNAQADQGYCGQYEGRWLGHSNRRLTNRELRNAIGHVDAKAEVAREAGVGHYAAASEDVV